MAAGSAFLAVGSAFLAEGSDFWATGSVFTGTGSAFLAAGFAFSATASGFGAAGAFFSATGSDFFSAGSAFLAAAAVFFTAAGAVFASVEDFLADGAFFCATISLPFQWLSADASRPQIFKRVSAARLSETATGREQNSRNYPALRPYKERLAYFRSNFNYPCIIYAALPSTFTYFRGAPMVLPITFFFPYTVSPFFDACFSITHSFVPLFSRPGRIFTAVLHKRTHKRRSSSGG